MVTSDEIKRKLEEKRRQKEGISSQPTPTRSQPDTTSSRPSKGPVPKRPPLKPPVQETEVVEEVSEEAPAEVSDEEVIKYCPNCDVEYTGDTNFCPDCGSKLEIYEPPVEEPEEPEIEEEHVDSFAAVRMDYTGDIMVVTSNYVPGYKAVKTLGFVYGLTVRSRGVGGQIGAGIRSVFGGEIKEYVKMMEQARNEALHRMVEHAQSMGANAIISSRFDSDEISDIMQEILAYGTAVIIEEEEQE